MKREGRIQGSTVRLTRYTWGTGHGHKPSNKPTNQPKNSYRLPAERLPQQQQGSAAFDDEHELPLEKSSVKIRGAFKSKNPDITRSHLMEDWSIYESGNAQEEEVDYERWEAEEETGEGEGEGQPRRAGLEMVLPIESLLSKKSSKRKTLPKATLQQTSSGSVDELAIESWWGLDFLGGEDVGEEWYLVSGADEVFKV